MEKFRLSSALGLAAGALMLVSGTVYATDSYVDVGKQEPITILINSSPWYRGFEAVVELYEEQTGNRVSLEVTPFNGMLEKARAAVRSPGTSPLDLVNIDSPWTIEFYEGGFLTPLTDIDPAFEVPDEVYAYDDSGCWDQGKRFRTCDSGTLMGYSPNGNIQLQFYRGDVFKEKGLSPARTFDEVLKNCEALHNPSDTYGYLQVGQRGGGVTYSFMPYLLSYGGNLVADPLNGDYSVILNSPAAQQALDKFIEVSQKCGPENYGIIGQGDLIQLLQTGKGLQAHAVVAAFPNFDDPRKSAVVDKIESSVLPSASMDASPGVGIANWVFGIPHNASDSGKKGALAFSKWFLTYEAQYAYAEAGAIPVRRDVYASDLKLQREFRWMDTYQDAIEHGKQIYGYAEGAAVVDVLELKLNQALIGELSSAAALNAAAEEMHKLFVRSGRKTGTLTPLSE
ncbi:hypothetical protein A8C75_14010 [Marinobacterium aestuarii]|uniref:ABC transporter substrate-binding protein n=1 Tax=Marinobacterium aestuarii TaxID=1821621 RepID=A0A1A9EZU7_9GAMM|nr:extracellular solute-binding protein [Marinobacterium aestuarii]ANG63476.1 hypothetical protein A8C75_14010 [Marinobacterium aestuarii]